MVELRILGIDIGGGEKLDRTARERTWMDGKGRERAARTMTESMNSMEV